MQLWQILDVHSIWMKEFASALSGLERVVAWSPCMEYLGAVRDWERTERLASPELEITYFPLQRGYARAPLRSMVPFEKKMLARLLSRTPSPESSPLICSTPFYAPVAELWPGPVVYYVTDLTSAYEGLNAVQVRGLDTRMCRRAQAVCPNSKRIAEYLIHEAGCEAGKITVLPNATRSSNIADEPRLEVGPVPADAADLPRPLVGVLGDLSSNMDWELLKEVLQATPGLSWLFVGPTSRPIADKRQSAARRWAQAHARFVGMKPYGELQQYARCLDAAVLPYRRKEPTYSGSSTRFYEHLAAGRPMVATRGFAELQEKVPLITLVDTAEEMVAQLQALAHAGFQDGLEEARWTASRTGTWEERARMLRGTIGVAIPGH